MLHFFHRGLPSRARQSLLLTEVRAVADGTARDNQSFRAGGERHAHRSQILLLRRRHNGQPNQADHERTDEREPEIGHRTTVTETRSHPFHKNPLGFHGVVAGCVSPFSSVARQRIVNVPAALAFQLNCHCLQAYGSASPIKRAGSQVFPSSIDTSTFATLTSPPQATPWIVTGPTFTVPPSPGAAMSDFTTIASTGIIVRPFTDAPGSTGFVGTR